MTSTPPPNICTQKECTAPTIARTLCQHHYDKIVSIPKRARKGPLNDKRRTIPLAAHPRIREAYKRLGSYAKTAHEFGIAKRSAFLIINMNKS